MILNLESLHSDKKRRHIPLTEDMQPVHNIMMDIPGRLLADFHKGLEQKQFKVYYQPAFDIRTEVPVLAGAEALVRWDHPELGLINSGAFIRLFEEHGLIQELDAYVWKEIARQIREWKDKLGFCVPVCVNISRADLDTEDLTDRLLEILKDRDLSVRDLNLELTEQAFAKDPEQIVKPLYRLREAGFMVAIDNFGSGYLSMKTVASLPIDTIKLDIAFIRSAFIDSVNVKVPEAIIAIASELSMGVVAEGVETVQEFHGLKIMGCDIIQGAFYSNPVPADQMEKFIRDRGILGEFFVQEEQKPVVYSPEYGTPDLPFGQIAQTLSAGFKTVFYVDTQTDHFMRFSSTGRYEELQLEKTGDDYFANAQKDLEDVYHQDRVRVGLMMRKNALLSKLNGTQPFTITYRMMVDGVPRWHKIKAVRVLEKNSHHIVIGIVDIDAQINRDQDYVADTGTQLTYASIAQALAADYFTIYYVDTDSDNFIEFSSYEEYNALKIEKNGEDFFNLSRKNILRVVYPDDQAKFLRAFTKENIMREMEQNHAFSLSYRLMFSDEPSYVYLKALPTLEKEDHHIVIGVSRVDAQMRMEKEFAKELEDAKMLANRDALTGVKSKHAYSEAEKRINRLLEAGDTVELAVAICDVNGLKDVNDTLGHKAGDEHLKKACRMICETFKHSPVFRVGGDEFVVLIQGHDYGIRDELTEEFQKMNLKNRAAGGVVVAIGVADLVNGEDFILQQVFDHADAAMYRNKKELKGETV